MIFSSVQNIAQRAQLTAELGRINSDLNSLSVGRERLINLRSRMRTSRDDYSRVRNRVLNQELTSQIRVQNRFQGQCANTLRTNYRATVSLLSPRENSVGSLMAGIDAQILRIDTTRTTLQSRRATVVNQLNNLN
jgi:hypothetical protein